MNHALTLAVAALALVHCSSDKGNAAATDGGASSSTSSSSGSSGTLPDGGTLPTADGGAPDDAQADGAPATNEADHVGAVTIEENNTESEGAQFYDVPPVARCTIRTSGVCTIASCPVVDPADPSAQSTPVNGGTVTVAGGTSPSFALTEGVGAVQATPPWKAGDTLSITSAGAVVPAFTASLVYPSLVTVTAPAPAVPDYTIPISRTNGVRFSWTSATPTYGGVAATVLQTRATTNLTISCLFDQGAGTGLMPADAISDLATGGDPHGTAVSVSPTSSKVLAAGAYRVTNTILRFNPYYAVYGIVQ